MDSYMSVLKNYATFSGRARRKEYWMFTLISTIIYMVPYVTAMVLEVPALAIISGIYILAVLIPTIAVAIRRLHDTDRSGWWILISLVPLVGGLIFLIFMVMDGTAGDNQFGADPKAGERG